MQHVCNNKQYYRFNFFYQQSDNILMKIESTTRAVKKKINTLTSKNRQFNCVESTNQNLNPLMEINRKM